MVHARARDIAPWVGEHGTVEAVSDDDAAPRCRVVTGSWSWDGLAAQLGMFGVPFDVVGPAELRRAVAVLADRFGRATASGTSAAE